MDCSGGKCYGLLAVSLILHKTWKELMTGSPVLLCTCFVPFITLCPTHWRQNYQDKACCHPEWVSLNLHLQPDVDRTDVQMVGT